MTLPRHPFDRRELLAGFAASMVAPLATGCRGKTEQNTIVTTAAHQASRVLRVIDARPAIDGAGATVARVFPTPALRNLDPFVLLDDFNVRIPAGFPDHPHRGFEAFTYMIEGAFEHKDNLGNASRVTAGGTQRFNSGSGARHSEMPGTDGPNRGLQLWVNLPRRLKSMDPEYADTQADTMPVAEDPKLSVRTIAGAGSPVSLHTEVEYLDVRLLEGAAFEYLVAEARNTLVYALEGGLRIDGREVRRGQGALMSAGQLTVNGERGSRFALLSGRPHGEPINHRGPFVD